MVIIRCFEIERKNNKKLYFNESENDININGINYIASEFNFDDKKIIDDISDISKKFSSKIESGFNNKLIQKDEIDSYMYAIVKIFLFDNIKTKSFGSQSGFVYEIEIIDNNRFFFKLKPLLDSMNIKFSNQYSNFCRADFGDNKCGIDINKFFYYGSVSELKNQKTFIDFNAFFQDSYFENGTIYFSEENNIYNNDVKKAKINFFLNKTFEISFFYNEFEIIKNMKFIAIPGCNKTLKMCSKKYDNSINFRGEPFIPGIEKIYNI